MINFRLKFGKWLEMTGKDLKGNALVIVLAFLAFVIALAFMAVTTFELPKIQVLF